MPNREVFRLRGPLKASKAGGGGVEIHVLGVGTKGMRATDPVGPLPGSLLLSPPRGPLAHLLHYYLTGALCLWDSVPLARAGLASHASFPWHPRRGQE